MTMLIEFIGQHTTPKALGKIGKVTGVDEATARQSVEVISLVIHDGLARKSQTAAGLDEIMSMLGEGEVASGTASADILGRIFGQAIGAVSKVLSDKLGFDPMPLLIEIAPVLLRAIADAARSQNLDAPGVANLLQTEQRCLTSQLSPEVLGLLKDVEAVTLKADTVRQLFTADEWTMIRLSPLAVAFYVMSASPSGLIGLAKEMTAAGDAMREVLKDADATSLVNIAFGDAVREQALDEDSPRESMMAIIRMAAEAVKAKMPGEAQRFADALNALAQKVAEAAKEGGFLGIGAKTVNQEERRALDEIRAALA